MNIQRRLLLCFLFSFTCYGGSDPLKLEVLCPKTFSILKKKDLCKGNLAKCRWSQHKSSKRASSWVKRDQLKVIENPLLKGLKVEVINPKISGISLPWCFKNTVITLPNKKILKELKDNREVLYLLEKKDTHHLLRLKAIKHPCRKLQSLKSTIDGLQFYYLEPQKLRACRPVQ